MWRRDFDSKMLAISWVVVVGMLTALIVTFSFALLKSNGWLWLLAALPLLCGNLAVFSLGLHYLSKQAAPAEPLQTRYIKRVLRRRTFFGLLPNPQLITWRLEALEAILETTRADLLPLAVPYMAHPNAHLRTLSARAVGHCFAKLSPQEAATYAWPVTQTLVEAYDQYDLSRYVLLETLLLMGPNGDAVLRHLFTSLSPEPLLLALLDAPNAWMIAEATDYAVDGLYHTDPEMKAVSLRYLGKTLRIPGEAKARVLELTRDPIFFVRVQALKLTPLLDQHTAITVNYEALGDKNWWVRKRAATVLHSLDSVGVRVLEYAKLHHPDAFARDSAANQLLEIDLENHVSSEAREVLI